MRALVCSGAMPPPCPGFATAMLTPILDRPAAFYLLETLASAGVTEVTVIDAHNPFELYQTLGQGERWGMTIQYISCPPKDVGASLVHSGLEADEEILLIHDDLLMPVGPVEQFIQQAPVNARLTAADELHFHQYGWMKLHGRDVIDMVYYGIHADALWSQALLPYQQDLIAPPFDRQNLLPISGQLATHGWHANTLLFREIDQGILVGPQASIDPTAKLIGPCVIGAHSIIGAQTTIGPEAYVGADCIVCDQAELSQGILLDHTMLEPGAKEKESVLSYCTATNLPMTTSPNDRTHCPRGSINAIKT